MQNWLPQVLEALVPLGLRILAGGVILFVGFALAKATRSWVRKWLIRSKVESTVVSFVCNLVYVVVLAFATIAALNQVGVQTASIIAVLGAAGLSIGLALQGSLSNFAAGVLIVLFRPFRVGDFIEGGGATGSVEEIQIFSTIMKTVQNQRVVVPNAKILNDNITNYTSEGLKRVDLAIGVGYGEDIDRVKKILLDILEQHPQVLRDPEPMVGLMGFGDSSIDLVVRPWVSGPEHYWPTYFDLMETVKLRFDEENIEIPFPQQDVNFYDRSKVEA